MITVPADIFAAMHRDVIYKRLRVTWNLTDGSSLDVTDRVTKVGTITRSLKALFGGYSASAFGVTLANHDKMFSERAAVSIFANRDRTDYIGSTMIVEQAVQGDTSGWYYLPVASAYVTKMTVVGRKVELRCVPTLGRYLKRQIPETITLDPNTTASEHVEAILTNWTPLTSGDLDSASFDFAKNVQYDLQWTVYGQIAAGTSVHQAAEDVAHSGLGQIYCGEDGAVYYETEFPRTSGDRERYTGRCPVEINETNAAKFTTAVGEDTVASRLKVKYQNVEAVYINEAQETALLAAFPRTVKMPYTLFYRCARTAAMILYETAAGYIDAARFTTHGVGLILQIGDRVPIKGPDDDAVAMYRIATKRWSPRWIQIEAVREWHLDTILDADMAQRGVTSWGDSARPML